MYLTDEDLIHLLKQCKSNLSNPSSLIVVKENIYDADNEFAQFQLDRSDNSVVRSRRHFE